MANPHHQWKIGGISPYKPKIKGWKSPKAITKKSAPRFGALSKNQD
jgi:hypothetical protein